MRHRLSRRLLAVAPLLLTAALAPVSAGHAAPAASAIRGSVMQSPAAPGPQRLGQDETATPLAGMVVELHNARGLVASATTAADGAFTLSAAPGVYVLHVKVEGMYPRCPDHPLTVHRGRGASAALVCDSGMR